MTRLSAKSLVLIGLLLSFSANADVIERHELELRALVQPDQVVAVLPAEIARAERSDDQHSLALLHLARANACRVLADWVCQRDASQQARDAALLGTDDAMRKLQVRALIALARAENALQNFAKAEQIMAETQLVLATVKSPSLEGELRLALSSFANSLGRNALAERYAQEGLAQMSSDDELPTKIRLLRNLARAQGKMQRRHEAVLSLQQAIEILQRVDDPKLAAELHLEIARIARTDRDVPTQMTQGKAILALSERLENSQLSGLAHEVIGLAQNQAGEGEAATKSLTIALARFSELNLRRDELRVLRALLSRDNHVQGEQLRLWSERFVALQSELEREEKQDASDSFSARVSYAEQKLELAALESEARFARQREENLEQRHRLTLYLVMAAIAFLFVLLALLILQRRWNRRLKAAYDRLERSEASYRLLAENARDVVVRVNASGERQYVSDSALETVGWTATELLGGNGLDLVHPEDREHARKCLLNLTKTGGADRICYRILHKSGHYIWVESLARVVPSPIGDGSCDVIYSSRDITERIGVEQALRESKQRLRMITDNIPALIAYVDANERVQFVNVQVTRMSGIAQEALLGRTVREVRGDSKYAAVQPHIQTALSGHKAVFEGTLHDDGVLRQYSFNLCPDFDENFVVKGFYALCFDITDQKRVQRELEHLARVDSLTGLANRRQFEERVEQAMHRRNRRALALFAFDIDRFKTINDQYGHLVGDEVLQEFALRLRQFARESDLTARLGGDEFMLLLEDAESKQSCAAVAERILSEVRKPFVLGQHRLLVTVSIGIAFVLAQESVRELTADADRALYAAKNSGRNTYRMA